MNISDKALNLIKRFEGFRAKPYLCPGDVWTIGYGTTKGVTPSSPPVTKAQAEIMLRDDVKRFEEAVRNAVNVPLNQHQFDALVSFTYNLGESALRRSTLLKVLNQGDYEEAANQFKRWNKADGKVLKGLVRRRKAESEMFLKPLTQSRTLAASTAGTGFTVGTAGIDMLQQSVDELSGQIEGFVEFSEYVKWAFLACTLISFGIVAYARIDDYRKQVR